MSIFEQIKSRLSVKEVYERYTGNKINRAGKSICVWHLDKNPSLSFHPTKNFCKCFVCENGGDVVEIVESLFNLTPIEAARKLDEDFYLGLMNEKLNPITKALIMRAERERKEKRASEEKLKAEQNIEYDCLCEENHKLEEEYRLLVPQTIIYKTEPVLPWESDIDYYLPLYDDFYESEAATKAFDVAIRIQKNNERIGELLELL